MPIVFDRYVFFDMVRDDPFSGSLEQEQVDGMNAILGVWEDKSALGEAPDDLRHLAYPLATTLHETASTMMPIEEYGKGSGMEYGKPDPVTGQTYYGRGYVQLTWKENYQKADKELGFGCTKDDPTSCEWHPENQLKPDIAAETMFRGMEEGWFRGDEHGRETLSRYFDADTNDPFQAREIINGDKNKVPSWSGGKSIGTLIKEYHLAFLDALEASAQEVVEAEEVEVGEEPPEGFALVSMTIRIRGCRPQGFSGLIPLPGKDA